MILWCTYVFLKIWTRINNHWFQSRHNEIKKSLCKSRFFPLETTTFLWGCFVQFNFSLSSFLTQEKWLNSNACRFRLTHMLDTNKIFKEKWKNGWGSVWQCVSVFCKVKNGAELSTKCDLVVKLDDVSFTKTKTRVNHYRDWEKFLDF